MKRPETLNCEAEVMRNLPYCIRLNKNVVFLTLFLLNVISFTYYVSSIHRLIHQLHYRDIRDIFR